MEGAHNSAHCNDIRMGVQSAGRLGPLCAAHSVSLPSAPALRAVLPTAQLAHTTADEHKQHQDSNHTKMDILSLVTAIWDAKNKLKEFVATVKANPKQSRTLWERVDALTPKLKQIEVAHKTPGKQPANDPTVQRQLATMLSSVEDAVSLVSKFSSASSLSRLWNKSDYSKDFAEINAAITQAQADLGFGLQVSELFSRQRDADDAKDDLADISRKQDQIMKQMEVGFEAQAVGQVQLFNEQQAFVAARFASLADKQSAMLKWQRRIEAEIKQAQLRSKQPASPAASVSSSSCSSAHSPTSAPRDILAEVLRIPLADLELGAKLGGGGFGDVYKSVRKHKHASNHPSWLPLLARARSSVHICHRSALTHSPSVLALSLVSAALRAHLQRLPSLSRRACRRQEASRHNPGRLR